MIRHALLGLIAGLAVLATASVAAPTRFQIDAQYQGGITVDLGHIGDTSLDFQPQRDGNIRVTGTGRVVHPREKDKVLEFALDMAFRVEGNYVRTAWSRNTSNANGQKLLEKVERILPLVHVSSTLTPQGGERHFYTKSGVLGARTESAGDTLQTIIEDGPRVLVTFYLRRAPDGQLELESFKVPTKDGVMLTFTAGQPLAFASLRF